MLLLFLDVDHLLAVFALADVAPAVGLVKVYTINGEDLFAVFTLLVFWVHFSYYSNKIFSNFYSLITT